MKAGKVLKIIGNIVLWVFVIFAAVLTIFSISSSKSKSGVPEVFGKMMVSIVSPSMEPNIMTGDLIVSDALAGADEKAELQVGDVITFFSDINGDGVEELNTHRIIQVREAQGFYFFRTQGDNNDLPDETEVRSDSVVGKYTGTRIPGVGSALMFLRQPMGFLLCIVAPLALFFLYELYRFISLVVSSRAKKLTPEEEEAIKQKAIAEYMAEQEQKKTEPEDGQNKD